MDKLELTMTTPSNGVPGPTETQFTWVVEWMQCYVSLDGLRNVVFSAGVKCNGVFADTYGSVYQVCSFAPPDPNDFIDYDHLTEAQVLSWCWTSGINKTAIELAVDKQIQNQIAPPPESVVLPPLPWNRS